MKLKGFDFTSQLVGFFFLMVFLLNTEKDEENKASLITDLAVN